MLTRERKAHIQAVLQRDGRVVAKALSHELGLSEDTIRRDLRELAGEGLLQRVHGGALPAAPAAANLAARRRLGLAGKQAIGRAAAKMVQSGQVVFLDGGTTAIQVAKHLDLNLRATIVTHSPNVAIELVDHEQLEVQLIGGRLFRHSMVAVGAAAIEQIARVRADLYFMGVTGVHPEIGLTTGDAEEAAVKREISRMAGETIVLVSAEKLGAASPFVVAPLAEVSGMIVEGGASEDVMQPYVRFGLSIIEANG